LYVTCGIFSRSTRQSIRAWCIRVASTVVRRVHSKEPRDYPHKKNTDMNYSPLLTPCQNHNYSSCGISLLCTETVGSKRSHWTRLCGACTMLVLLGVPWIFSAFGVIDTAGSNGLEMLQGIFNVSNRCIRYLCGLNAMKMGRQAAHLPQKKMASPRPMCINHSTLFTI